MVYQEEVIDSHFMVGREILVAPHLESTGTVTQVYLPGDRWYSLRDMMTYEGGIVRMVASPL